MRILALDATTEACSVALYDGGQMLGRYEELARGQGERLLGMVRELLREADWALTDLDGMAAGIGPGSFTGVRMSVAVAQGLAFGAGLRVVPVSSLEALALKAVSVNSLAPNPFALAAEGGQRMLACLDARMGELYWGCFAADAARGVIATSPAQVGPESAVRLTQCPAPGIHQGIGRGFRAYPALGLMVGVILRPEAADALPDAKEIARLGALRLAAGEGLDPGELAPLYVRDKVALTETERQALRPGL
jgi:tRNA threonylcarbamoyladenosine biosynthesis protein TsaB